RRVILLSLWPGLVAAQGNLGELLDAGATKMTPDQFRLEIVQRPLVGPAASGGVYELVYGSNNVVSGLGSQLRVSSLACRASVSGTWNFDEVGRVCATMQMVIEGGVTSQANNVALAPRCQSWYKLGEAYYVSDSDTERNTKVLRRTLKQ